MEPFIDFEKSLFENCTCNFEKILDEKFILERLVSLPSYRPFFLENCVQICQKLCEHPSFKERLLKESMKNRPILLYRLFKAGIYCFDSIWIIMNNIENYICFFYFM